MGYIFENRLIILMKCVHAKIRIFALYGKEPFSVHAGSEGDSDRISDAWDRGLTGFFNREPDVKLSVRRCRVQGSFRGRDVPAT